MREKMLLNKKFLEFDLRYVYQFSDRWEEIYSIKLSVFSLSISGDRYNNRKIQLNKQFIEFDSTYAYQLSER